ncbi:MAG TPA: 3-hydroxyacyl-ACP dehydratase FabZ, partial [Methylotenera sp.]|nr:3-hydroxyacyl-ACP dehydratase FabZ [Methylotenera sp.]
FPYHPVMPGVLIVEAMAQAAAVLSFKTMDAKPNDESVYYFAGIDSARFKKPVSPGDQIVLNVKIDRILKGIWKYTGSASVDNEVVAEASMMCILKAIEK